MNKSMITRKPRKYTPYCEIMGESPWLLGWVGKNVCRSCRASFKERRKDRTIKGTCGCNNPDIVYVGTVARPPRKNASKRKWKEFWEKYAGAHPAGCR